MNDRRTVRNPYKPSVAGSDDRELFVTTDLRSIPAMELRPMCGSHYEWLLAVLAFKVFRAKSEVAFACESRRLVRVDAEHVPKRIMSRFEKVRPKIESLGFLPNYYASMPAIGPIAAAVMTMSREDGQIHYFAIQVVAKSEGQVNDAGHFSFSSSLPSGESIVTVSPANLPRPRRGIDRLMVSSDDPATVLKKHRERIRGVAIVEVPPAALFESAEQETRLEADDLLRRRIIRPATPAEIARIRAASRV